MGSKKKAPVPFPFRKLHSRDKVKKVRAVMLFRIKIEGKTARAITSIEFIPLYEDGSQNISLTTVSKEVYRRKISNDPDSISKAMQEMKAKFSNLEKTRKLIEKHKEDLDYSEFKKKPRDGKRFIAPPKLAA